MRLTNAMRSCFVNAVMADVPNVEYPTVIDLQKMLVSLMPQAVMEVYKNPDLRIALKREYYHCSNSGGGYVYVGTSSVAEVQKPYDLALGERCTVEKKIRQAADSCTTLEQLQKSLPDLVKYMPTEKEPALKNLPAVTGVIEDLKKLGFPK